MAILTCINVADSRAQIGQCSDPYIATDERPGQRFM